MGTALAVECGSVVFGGMIALSSTHSKPIETPVDEVVNRCKPGETRRNQWKPGETRGNKGKSVETRGNQVKPGETRGKQLKLGETRGTQVKPGKTRGNLSILYPNPKP